MIRLLPTTLLVSTKVVLIYLYLRPAFKIDYCHDHDHDGGRAPWQGACTLDFVSWTLPCPSNDSKQTIKRMSSLHIQTSHEERDSLSELIKPRFYASDLENSRLAEED